MQAARTLKADPSRSSLTNGTGAVENTSGNARSSSSESAADLTAKLSKLRALSEADKQLIATLQAKVDEQKKELDNRTVTIGAIQRNFENLSNVAAAERAELEQMRAAESGRRKEREEASAELLRLHAELRRLVEKENASSGSVAAAQVHTHH